MKPNKFFSAIFIVFGVLLLNPLSAQQRASLPYYTDFGSESQAYWELGFAEGTGLVAWAGSNLRIQDGDEDGYGIGYGDLHLDLSQESKCYVDLSIVEFYPGQICWPQQEAIDLSGVYLSDNDGATFTKVYSFENINNVWVDVNLNISKLADQYGLYLNNQFIIRLQYYTYHSDPPWCIRGCLIDYISVYSCPTDFNITTNISAETSEYLSSNQITASNEISNGAIVHYGANNSVKLQTGFKVNSGVSFVADLDGCSATATLKSANLGGSNEEEQEVVNYSENIVNIYPNPSQGQFNINIKNESKVSVLNSFGTVVYKGNLQVGENKVDLSQNSKGLFVIVVDDGNQAITEKVLIE